MSKATVARITCKRCGAVTDWIGSPRVLNVKRLAEALAYADRADDDPSRWCGDTDAKHRHGLELGQAARRLPDEFDAPMCSQTGPGTCDCKLGRVFRHLPAVIDHDHVSEQRYVNDCVDCRHNLTTPLGYCITHRAEGQR